MGEGEVLTVLVLGPLVVAAVNRFLRNRERLRVQEMGHRERMLAMEKGLPVSELPGGDLELWSNDSAGDRFLESGWDRRMTLATGLVMLFASIGSLLYAVLLPGTSEDAVALRMATGLAVIPLMASFGLLLHYRLTASED